MSAQERAQLLDKLARIAIDPAETQERRERAAQAVRAAFPDWDDAAPSTTWGYVLPDGGALHPHSTGGAFMHTLAVEEGWGR